jgi:hypothetical protein
MSETVKLSTVLALAPSSSFYAAQIARLLKQFETGDNLITAACSMYMKCMDLESGVDTITNSLPVRDVKLIKERLGHRATFRGSNPTGHYVLVRVNMHFHADINILRAPFDSSFYNTSFGLLPCSLHSCECSKLTEHFMYEFCCRACILGPPTGSRLWNACRI